MLAVIKTSLYYYLREFKDVGVNRVSVGVQVCEAWEYRYVKHANKMSHFLNKILEQMHTAIGNIWKYFMWYV